jgi:hypothetical protein
LLRTCMPACSSAVRAGTLLLLGPSVATSRVSGARGCPSSGCTWTATSSSAVLLLDRGTSALGSLNQQNQIVRSCVHIFQTACPFAIRGSITHTSRGEARNATACMGHYGKRLGGIRCQCKMLSVQKSRIWVICTG